MDLANKNELLNYLKSNGLWAKKGLSQNFLVDKNALDKIVSAAEIKSDDFVIEIGPGPGTLTAELVKSAGEVVAVEMDENLAEILKQKSKAKIICGDILKINLGEIVGKKKYKVVANIPYHITSKILELFLARENKPKSMVSLVQKEVAERICAKPGEMSTLSISVQLYGEPEIVDIVKSESFFPAPKVDSAILKISNIKNPIFPLDEKSFFRLVHIGFASRRKTLANNLAAGYCLDKKIAFDIIKSVGLKETVRAQELTIENWRALCRKLSTNQKKSAK